MEECKIVVLCGGKFSFPAIQLLAFNKYLAGIGFGGDEKNLPPGLREESLKNNYPFEIFNTNRSVKKMKEWLEVIRPHVVFCICFPFKIPEDVLSVVPGKFINFHPGPLPSYRGPSPIFEVLKYREKETALSVHIMDAAYDKGPLILSETISIAKGETFGALAMRLSKLAGMTASNIAEMVRFGTMIPTTEQTEEDAHFYEKPNLRDTLINWEYMEGEEIEALVNACNPWNNGADVILNGLPMKILVAECLDVKIDKPAGTLSELDAYGRLMVACTEDKCLAISVLSNDAGVCTAAKFVNDNKVIGQKFS